MKVWLVVLAFPGLAWAGSPSKSGAMIRFEDLPSLVRVKNENVQAAHFTLKAHGERTGVLTRSFVPRLSAKVGTEEFRPGDLPSERLSFWKIEAAANLWRGGRDLLESSLRDSNVRRADEELKLTYNQELKEARKTYWQLIATTKQIADKKEELAKNEGNLKSTRRRAGAGVASAADSAQFELQRTILVQDLKKLQLLQDVFRNRLSVAIGRDEHEDLIVEADFPKPVDDLTRIEPLNTEKNPTLRVLREKENAERIRQSQTKRWWHPKVDLYVNYGLPSLSEDYTRAVWRERQLTGGIRAAFDLSDGLDARREASASGFEADSLQKKSSHAAREITAEDHELRHDLRILVELITDADRDIEKAAQFMRLTENEYSRGVKNGPDLLSAVEKVFEVRRRRTELYREYHETRADLMALLARDGYQ